jgi:positive regulator of sigma E activity
MTIEYMSVVDADEHSLHLSSRNQQHCNHCVAKSGCGLQLLNKIFIKKQEILSLPYPHSYRGKVGPGNEIKVSIDDRKLTRLALLQYAFPITITVAATATAESVANAFGLNEGWVILSALAALAAGLAGVRYISFIFFGNDRETPGTQLLDVLAVQKS